MREWHDRVSIWGLVRLGLRPQTPVDLKAWRRASWKDCGDVGGRWVIGRGWALLPRWRVGL